MHSRSGWRAISPVVFFISSQNAMQDWTPLFYVIGYALVAIVALWMVDARASHAAKEQRRCYEDALATLHERVCDLYVENQDLKAELADQRRALAAMDLSVYQDVEA
jgi:hypothetical protein